jgi:hypothetical protein
MKSGEHRDEIISKERVIGFEMEGAWGHEGVWYWTGYYLMEAWISVLIV